MAETEAILLKRFTRSGDAAAFAEIIRRHAGLVYSAALRVLADVDRASDVAQETFLQLTKDAGDVTGSLPGWLHRVATRKAIDQMRRETARRHREMKYTAEQPRKTAEWKDISPHVDRALYELNPELREVLILHFLQDRSTREIARLRHTSQATVSRRIEAGVQQLRAKLRKRGILVAVSALSVLLGNNAVEAAPGALLVELGKMAMAGGSIAVAAGGASGVGSTLETIAAGAVAAVKANAVAVAAVAVIATGSAVTYHQVAKSPSDDETQVVFAESEAVESASSPEGDVRTDANLDHLDRRSDYVQRTLAAWKEATIEAEQDPATFVPGPNETGDRDDEAALTVSASPPQDVPEQMETEPQPPTNSEPLVSDRADAVEEPSGADPNDRDPNAPADP